MTHTSVLKRRAREQAKKDEKVRKMEIYLAGGPCHGQTLWVPASVDRVRVGLWTYTYAGKMDTRTYFAKKLKSRAANRALMKLIAHTSRDPRLEAISSRPIPMRRTAEPKQGQGARKRAARRRSLAESADE